MTDFQNAGSQWTGEHAEKSRMQMVKTQDWEQFLMFPEGTEVLMVTLAPLGVALAVVHLTVDDPFREETKRYIEANEEWNFAFVMYLLPENVALPDDVATIEPDSKEN